MHDLRATCIHGGAVRIIVDSSAQEMREMKIGFCMN